MEKLVTEHLSKRYQNQTILQDINLRIDSGEVYGLLGINGAGKTTLMKILCGIIKQNNGRVFYDRHEMTRNDLHHIGALIEAPAVYNHLSAQDNLKIVCLNENISFSKIEETLELVNLNVSSKKKTKDFSLGMRQRLGIALALIKNPDFLVLDEPSNGLDPYGIEQLRVLLKNLTKNGTSILISSHILSELQILSDKIGILHNGNLEYQEKNDSTQNLEKIFFKITRGEYL